MNGHEWVIDIDFKMQTGGELYECKNCHLFQTIFDVSWGDCIYSFKNPLNCLKYTEERPAPSFGGLKPMYPPTPYIDRNILDEVDSEQVLDLSCNEWVIKGLLE